MNSFLFLIFAILLGLNEAHRHHQNHHGRHHEDEHRHGGHHHGEHHRHRSHKSHDVEISVADLSTPENETISIVVTRKLKGQDNEQGSIKVSLRIHTIKGVIHINGHRIDHSVVTSLHVRTVIDETSLQGEVVKKPAVVQVRVMVTESTNANGMRLLTVQEQIVEVADDEVDQIDVKELVLEFGNGVQEKRRSITVIKLAHSKIHKQPREADKHVWARKGKLPKDPFCVSKREMTRWNHRHMRPPSFELGRNKGEPHDNGDDDDDDDDKDDDEKDKHHHRKHHHGFKHWGRRFCAWFHRLPVATRAAFGVSVVLFGILIMAACWTCCCKKPKPARKSKYEMGETASMDGECEDPLPEKKKPLDEQPLVA